MPAAEGIGTRKEKSLHAALKQRYAGSGGRTEAEIGPYVCDAVDQYGVIVEVQTGNFGAIKRKLSDLTKNARVVLVHPISVSRTIELRSIEGELIRTRKSPRKGKPADIFAHLVRAPYLPALPGLEIELAMVDETELRTDDGAGSWRRKGVSIVDRKLDAVRETIRLSGPADYRRFLPDALPDPFTSKDLAAALSVRAELARKALFVLSRLGLATDCGKKGNAKLYRKTADRETASGRE